MALIWNRHGGEPVNKGEQRVIAQLADELPDGFTIVPDIQIPYRHHQVDEIDALVITPFAVIIVEIKDLRGRVVFDEQEHRVDGEVRPNPIWQNGYRARRLKGKLVDSSPALRNTWVADQVVLARDPQMLSINDAIASKVVLLANAAARLSDPKQILPHRPNREPVDADLVLRALGLIRRRSTSETFGNYRTTSLVEETEDGRLYKAIHRITEKPVSLRVHPIDRFLPRSEQRAARERALKAFKTRVLLNEKTGNVPQVIGPTDAFEHENGDVVTVSPLDTGVQLDSLGGADARFPVEVRLAIVRDVAAALNAAHGPGISHRRISPACIHVDLHQKDLRSVVARLGGWDRADLGPVERPPRSSSIYTEEDPFVAPEVADGSLRSWPPTDLWSFAKTVQWIWEDLGSTTGMEPLPSRLADLVAILLRTDPGERSASALDLFEAAETLLLDSLADQSSPEPITGIDELADGDELDSGRYVIRRVIKAGGTSILFDVEDRIVRERVALKLFRPMFSRDIKYLRAEISALRGIQHPSIVKLYDAVILPEGHQGLKMELLAGPDLRDFTKDHYPADQKTILEWFDKILDALEALHSVQIVHRDIKPENLIVVEESGLVLVDFGLAGGRRAAIGGETVGYRPAGIPANAANPELDLFALAITLHEALTQDHPFEECSTSRPLMLCHKLPEPLMALFLRALHEDASQQFGSAREFRDALGDVRRELGYVDPIVDPEIRPIPADDPVGGEIIHLGPKVVVRVLPVREQRTEKSTPAGVEDVQATIVKATIQAEPGIRLDIELCEADNGETWIRAVDAYRSPDRIQRLLRGLRAGIRPVPERHDKRFVELRQAKIIDDPNWPKIRKVSKTELDTGAGADVEELLKSLGASGIATRSDAWGDISNRKTDLCVVFDIDKLVVPIAVYALTRVAPLVDATQAEPNLATRTPKPPPPPAKKVAQDSDRPSRSGQIVALCDESMSLWNSKKKAYVNPSDGARARTIAEEIETIRRALANEIPAHLIGNDNHLLRSPPIERQQFKSGQWRSSTWIDLLYQTDTAGNPIDYDFVAKSDRGAHLFRIWFTARGVGIGVRPAGRKTHKTRGALISGLSTGYPDRQPLGGHKHESQHELCLKGRPGQINQYFAQWHHSFGNDPEFFEQVADAWSELGPVLNIHRC